jgi:uncharacterized protein involved in exopolysaccharide biosynthesis
VAKAGQNEVLRDLNSELRNAIQIAQVELRLSDARVESLEDQLADVRGRFDRLAGLRTRYANLVAETQNRTDLLQSARRTLADAHASQAAARTASLIAQIDLPDTGTRPVGLSRAMVVLIGLAGGLLTGFGVLLLTVRPVPTPVAPPAAEHSIPALPAVYPPVGSNQRILQPVSGLSLKQALQKIVYGNTA